MNAVRYFALFKGYRALQRNVILTKQNLNKAEVRHSHDEGKWFYRQAEDPVPSEHNKTVFIGTLTWWWILWHFFTEYEELFGPFFPNPRNWTDEELGIPPP